ncbi:dUTP diphosphatase [Terribacillus sp. JSM ZJ617]|uniref:dUTP diphosphatase n=1 Tax=Terribacillus sp. JSM ZJ617 TaxID=3342119 RepID=UPI0035A88D8A
MIDFIKLAPFQKQLDAHIIQKRGLEGQDLLLNTIFALQVEVAELANEVRFFKHWSADQEPRLTVIKDCEVCNGEGRFKAIDEYYEYETCSQCSGTGHDGVRNPVAEEYVDCLHFVLSIGNQLGVDWKQIDVSDDGTFGIPRAFGLLISSISSMWKAADAYKMSGSIRMKIEMIRLLMPVTELLIDIGRLLDFTAQDIESAYMDKHEENYHRQANGY